MWQPAVAALTFNTVTNIFYFAGMLLAISLVIWQTMLYKQLEANAKDIRAKQDELDAVPKKMAARTSGSQVNQSQLERLIENDKEPLEHELKKLEREREFIKDRLLFAKK